MARISRTGATYIASLPAATMMVPRLSPIDRQACMNEFA